MIERFDVKHNGNEKVICAHRVGDVIVDPGPTNALDNWLPALGDFEPRAILLTHIHLDHAAATGELVRRFPKAEVYVHEVGAPHMVDPTRLLASAGRVYDGPLEEIFGEFAPVPAENVHTIADGEAVYGFRALHTPGHSGHHLSFLHEETGTALTGDVAGVSFWPHQFAFVPTPPPEIDLDLWDQSIVKLQEWGPQSLSLTHFGEIPEAGPYLERFVEDLSWTREQSRAGDPVAYRAAIEARAAESLPAELHNTLWQAATAFDQVWMGLDRFWRKRAEREQS